ncbi:MAG: DEAD/DEAH box helicase [Cyanobacteria bacterium J06626_14]
MSSHAQTSLDLETIFPFKLDTFQLDAIAALDAGRSVVVCAPTGSGKTLVGEYAIYHALSRGKRVFYTTPLKALSNQKLRDFRHQFGTDNVGLLTGDISINRDAPVVVMTTEIFRNMLYGTSIGQVGTSLSQVETVVLDECHYMNDRQRGTVWEESIIYALPEIQLVALSATVANSDQLTDWIQTVHGPTQLIYSDFRPVPLRFHFCNPQGLHPLLNTKQTAVNPKLKPRGKQKGKLKAPSIPFVVSQLHKRDMLPAIYFIFSRRGCDRAVADMGNVTLVDEAESRALQSQIDAFLTQNPEAARRDQVGPLYRGIAAHHAGILPAWKGLVEELFQQGLIKVVFATETLAAGINMPARTTVISSLSKRTDRGHRLLNGSEFLQMAGRAGRRGMDELGHVVTVQTRFEGAPEAAYLAVSGADPLISQFTPSYGMVLNLLQTHTLEEAKELVERSFGQYLASLHLIPQKKAIADLEALIEHQVAQVAHVDDYEVLEDYEKLSGRLKEERRLLKILQKQADDIQAKERSLALSFAVGGTILAIKGKSTKTATPLLAVLVNKIPGPGQAPYLVVLGRNNRWSVISMSDVVAMYDDLPRLQQADGLAPPSILQPKLGQTAVGDDDTQLIVQQLPAELPACPLAPEVQAQLERMNEVEAQLTNHSARQWGNPGKILKQMARLNKLEEELTDRRSKLSKKTQRYWQEFLSLIRVLQHFNCLNDIETTTVGQIAAAIRGDNELWLGLAIASGELDHLEPHQFASACSALVTEVTRPDSWSYIDPSDAVALALDGLKNLRRDLFKIQHRHQVAFPIWLDYDWVGLIEEWALESDWPSLCSNTSLDEGDLVRILRRTLDFLSQIPHIPHVSPEVKRTARQAIALIDRFPVNESIDAKASSQPANDPSAEPERDSDPEDTVQSIQPSNELEPDLDISPDALPN